jgi:haloacetate dehalogenase
MFESFKTVRFAGDTEIHAHVGGDGPPVLLLHGFPQTCAMWSAVAPILAKRFTIVAADLRGYGASGKPQASADLSNYSFRAMADDQVGLMRHLGFDRFHVVGHDRGGRTAHRMALDHPAALKSVAILDIVPTYVMFKDVNAEVARAYWHWYFLQQPYPYPEKIIAANPQHFYEGCLAGWGATGIGAFEPEQLAAYRAAWRDPDYIRGSCADYRAAAAVDFHLDEADLGRQVTCPALIFWGSSGIIAQLFDMQKVWSSRLSNMSCASLPGGHFFVDQFPSESANILERFLAGVEAGSHPQPV